MRPAFEKNKGTITGVFKGCVIRRLMERRGLKLPAVPPVQVSGGGGV
jgi:hypothetical protein